MLSSNCYKHHNFYNFGKKEKRINIKLLELEFLGQIRRHLKPRTMWNSSLIQDYAP